MEIVNNVREGVDKHYGIRGTKFLITWESRLEKNILTNWLITNFGSIREFHIAYNDTHTHCVIWFEKQVSRKDKNAFNYYNIQYCYEY